MTFTQATPAKQLDVFLSKYDPAIRSIALTQCPLQNAPLSPRKQRDRLRQLQCPRHRLRTQRRPCDAIFSIALYPRWVTLFLLQGANLSDPARRLQSSGKCVRQIRPDDSNTLDDPEILALIHQALHRAKTPIDSKQKRRLIIKSISPTQRPRSPS